MTYLVGLHVIMAERYEYGAEIVPYHTFSVICGTGHEECFG